MNEENVLRTSSAIRTWVTALLTGFISLFGVVLALVCIFALPDGTTRPASGAAFYFSSALILSFYYLLVWKKDKAIERRMLSGAKTDHMVWVVKESVSDKVMKWVVAIFTLGFIFSSLSIALICVYALPDKTVQPQIGIQFFLSGVLVLGVMVFVVCKNWVSARSRQNQ